MGWHHKHIWKIRDCVCQKLNKIWSSCAFHFYHTEGRTNLLILDLTECHLKSQTEQGKRDPDWGSDLYQVTQRGRGRTGLEPRSPALYPSSSFSEPRWVLWETGKKLCALCLSSTVKRRTTTVHLLPFLGWTLGGKQRQPEHSSWVEKSNWEEPGSCKDLGLVCILSVHRTEGR